MYALGQIFFSNLGTVDHIRTIVYTNGLNWLHDYAF